MQTKRDAYRLRGRINIHTRMKQKVYDTPQAACFTLYRYQRLLGERNDDYGFKQSGGLTWAWEGGDLVSS